MEPEIIEKVKKLLALAERGGTEAEGEAAMRAVHAVLARHNLSYAEVKQQIDKSSTLHIGRHVHTKQKTWERRVWSGIAELYFCGYIIGLVAKDVYTHCVLGKPANIQVVKFVAKSCVKQGEELARVASRGKPEPREYRISWLHGYSDRIEARCLEMIQQAKEYGVKDAETGTELVVAHLYDVIKAQIQEAVKDNISGTVDQSGPKEMNYRAYANGAHAANGVSLSKDVIGNLPQEKIEVRR